eukprot:32443-Pyramimonas_sp.AAC.1
MPDGSLNTDPRTHPRAQQFRADVQSAPEIPAVDDLKAPWPIAPDIKGPFIIQRSRGLSRVSTSAAHARPMYLSLGLRL